MLCPAFNFPSLTNQSTRVSQILTFDLKTGFGPTDYNFKSWSSCAKKRTKDHNKRSAQEETMAQPKQKQRCRGDRDGVTKRTGRKRMFFKEWKFWNSEKSQMKHLSYDSKGQLYNLRNFLKISEFTCQIHAAKYCIKFITFQNNPCQGQRLVIFQSNQSTLFIEAVMSFPKGGDE